MRRSALFTVTLVGLLPLVSLGAEAAPKVVVSIKPIHGLVSSVMAGIAEPELLIKGAGSPHAYNLRPSEARALSDADVVFRVGEALETFLDKPLKSLASGGRVVDLAEVPGLTLLDSRDAGVWAHDDHHGHHDEHDDHADHGDHGHGDHDHGDHEEHGDHAEHGDHDEHEHHDEHGDHDDHAGHDHGPVDMHIWLTPDNARPMLDAIVEALSAEDPANAARYAANSEGVLTELADLDAEIAARLAPVGAKPYVVFHDAYQYFEAHYGLRPVGAISVNPERAPGAKRLAALREVIAERDAVCVFSEPQFEPALVATIVEGTAAKSGELDPLGADLPIGPDSYFALLRGLADSLVTCLTPSS